MQSPIAQTPSAAVRNCPSTGMKPGGGQNPVAADRLAPLDLDDTAGGLGPGAGHLDAEADVEPLLAKQRQGLGGDVAVDAEENPVGVFQDGHAGAKPPPDAAEFKADVAAPDHHQVPRHLGKRERLGAGSHPIAVGLDPGQDDRTAADGQNDPRRLEEGLGPVGGRHRHPARPGKPTGPGVAGHLVLLEERLDPLGERRDDVVLPLHQRGQIEGHAAHADAVGGEFVGRLLVLVARLEQGLGGNAADPQAGAAELRLPLDDRRREPPLGRPDRRHVAPRTAADHHHVMRCCSHSSPFGCISGGVAHTNRAALETERSQDGEARFPSSDRTAGCRKGVSGEMAWATPAH